MYCVLQRKSTFFSRLSNNLWSFKSNSFCFPQNFLIHHYHNKHRLRLTISFRLKIPHGLSILQHFSRVLYFFRRRHHRHRDRSLTVFPRSACRLGCKAFLGLWVIYNFIGPWNVGLSAPLVGGLSIKNVCFITYNTSRRHKIWYTGYNRVIILVFYQVKSFGLTGAKKSCHVTLAFICFLITKV